MGKVAYAWMIQRDDNIPGTVVRSTTITEEMGRIQYLLSDKTGTLTQNEMVSLLRRDFPVFILLRIRPDSHNVIGIC